jgi:transcriptional antiterminator NusG
LGDIVEIVGGPFKGERGKVTRLNKQKSEVIVELLEAAVPIPITLNLDSIKVVGKENRGESE